MKSLELSLIKFYQKYLSLTNFGINVCRFDPRCSDYAYHAVDKHGVFKGTAMGFWRILRCNPFSKGGQDPVR